MIFLLLIVIAVVLLVIYVISTTRKPLNYPPGPIWLPFVGSVPVLKQLSKLLGGQHLGLEALAKKYNTDVLGLKLGTDYVIAVFSYSLVRAVLVGEEYDGRPDNFFIRLRSMGTKKGITGTDGELWKIQRNFVTSHLRNLGFGKQQMEELIHDEISETLSILKENGQVVQIGRLLAPAIINILWALTMGKRINRKDSRLNKLLDLFDVRTTAFDMSGGVLTQYPWLRYIAPKMTGYNLLKRINKDLKHFLMETITEHYETWTEGRDDDLIYSFISEMKKADGADTTFTEDQLIMVCMDIFIAGSQTTSSTLDFAFLSMILFPNIQEKVMACLDHAFSKREKITYGDRLRVPYIEAVLLEVQRCFHVTPIIGPRRVLRNTTLNGYFIPKNTTVLISLYSLDNDKEYWKDPEVFKPERFLDEDGKVQYQDQFLPFGLGKRRCLGEILARQCIFLFFVGVMRRYKISLPPGTKKLTGIPRPGITLSPENYHATFTCRNCFEFY